MTIIGKYNSRGYCVVMDKRVIFKDYRKMQINEAKKLCTKKTKELAQENSCKYIGVVFDRVNPI